MLGWPPDGPTLRLDYRRFSYAGKFVMSNTGKAVVRDPGETSDREYDDAVLAAVAFNDDRTDSSTLWLRYVTVRNDRRGEGLGPQLCRADLLVAAVGGLLDDRPTEPRAETLAPPVVPDRHVPEPQRRGVGPVVVERDGR